MFFLTIGMLAAGLISLAGAHFVAGGIAATRRSTRDRLRRFHVLRSCRAAAEIVRLDSQLQVRGGLGVAWRVMEVAEVAQESSDCRSFYLVDPYGQALPEFRPGQYLMVRPAMAGAFQPSRCYSLSSAPDSRYWRITVKRQQADPQPAAWDSLLSKRGGLSVWLHDNIRAGDCLLVGGPSGHFYLPADNGSPLVLLSAGVGITPLVSMLRWSLENTPGRSVTLHSQVRDTEHWPLGRYVHAWSDEFDHCRVITYFSRPTAAESKQLHESGIEWREGKFAAADVVQGQSAHCEYFMCGPDSWMEELRRGLVAAGVSASRIHWESFGNAVDHAEALGVGGERRQVTFARSDVVAVWDDPEQTLWELAKANDVPLPSGCLSGVCGSCRVKVLSGHVAYDRAIGVELAAGECLSCVARPQTDLQIEA